MYFYPSTDDSKVVFRVVSQGIETIVTSPCAKSLEEMTIPLFAFLKTFVLNNN
jgi:hypothetical protein